MSLALIHDLYTLLATNNPHLALSTMEKSLFDRRAIDVVDVDVGLRRTGKLGGSYGLVGFCFESE